MSENLSKNIAVIGAGAAGLMCAIEAGKNGHRISVFDHAKNAGEKIRISGGGRCNFTNKYCTSDNFISQNKHFCKSPLSRYPAENFISLVEKHKIPYHEKHPEKKTGQLFCDTSSKDIINMLLTECRKNNVRFMMNSSIDSIEKNGQKFTLNIEDKKHPFDAVIIATGGPSIPKMGASDFGYKIARQFGLKIIPPEPALVPLTFTDDTLNFTKSLSGLSIDSVLIRNKTNQNTAQFTDDLLFTHRGLSGPAILQISSYWKAGETLEINLLPKIDLFAELKQAKSNNPKMKLQKFLSTHLPARFVESFCPLILNDNEQNKNLADYSNDKLIQIANHIQCWNIKPNGTEGYRKAEVTRGGIDTNEIDNKTFESKKVSGLYFIGEVLDVTGHLGGHNFQWAWASGYACGRGI